MRVFCVLRLKCILDLPATSAAPGLLTVASFGLAIMNNVAERPLNGDVEDDDEDDGGGLEAWERTYAEDRSWEALQEDESGLLRPIDTTAIYHAQYRRRLRTLAATAATARIQKGLIRYLYIVVDLSKVFDYRFSVCF